MTSFIDNKKYRYDMFKVLYFKRWKVETFYDELKNITKGNTSRVIPIRVFYKTFMPLYSLVMYKH